MTDRRVASLALSAALVAACVSRDEPAPETWGLVATLGDDTTSVERMTRSGNRVTGDAVGRSPLVVRRRWQATLAPDGSVLSWTMDTRIANAAADQAALHHELTADNGAIRTVRHAGGDTTGGSVAARYARTVPWNAFLYGTLELLIGAAGELTDSVRVGVYFFEGWEEGRFGWVRLRRLADGAIGVASSGLSGEGIARVDETGRLLSYSGEGTTYKQEVRRVDDVGDLDAIFERFAAEERARGVSRVLSARDTMRATIAGADLEVDYSRPLARGRTLVGSLIPYDRVWRTGANAATQIAVGAPIRLGGASLEAGTYTLWTLPRRDGVQLIINAQTGQWGTGYDASHDLARVRMRVDTLDAPVEQFTIRVEPSTARLVLEWGTFRWSVPIESGR